MACRSDPVSGLEALVLSRRLVTMVAGTDRSSRASKASLDLDLVSVRVLSPNMRDHSERFRLRDMEHLVLEDRLKQAGTMDNPCHTVSPGGTSFRLYFVST